MAGGKPGRPSRYTAEIARVICARLAEGESLRSVCRDEAMPSEGRVRAWALDDVDGFAVLFDRARELQAHALAEEGLEAALAATDAATGRLAFDARRWAASKILPKVYGDRTETTLKGPGGPIAVETKDVTPPDNRVPLAFLLQQALEKSKPITEEIEVDHDS